MGGPARYLQRAFGTLGLPIDMLFVLFLITLAVLGWREIDSFPEPSGGDPGNWLALCRALLGSHRRSATIVYPPLVPLVTIGIAQGFGSSGRGEGSCHPVLFGSSSWHLYPLKATPRDPGYLAGRLTCLSERAEATPV